MPDAPPLGLRYVAHMGQADTRADILTLSFPPGVAGRTELQLFEPGSEAEEWLRCC